MGIEEVVLLGGMMNTPKLIGAVVHRVQTESTPTIHRLLSHVRASGIHWVPEPKGVAEGMERLSYIEGVVPHDMPDWIWSKAVLHQVARRLRDWHDATMGFEMEEAVWALETKTPHEVICHNDFAPYNCVFQEREMVGLIDFDFCAPGSRLWDMAYTAYRYIPVMPSKRFHETDDMSPFDSEEVLGRLEIFLGTYSEGNPDVRFQIKDLLQVMTERLMAISEWTRNHAQKSTNASLMKNAEMYASHSKWIRREWL